MTRDDWLPIATSTRLTPSYRAATAIVFRPAQFKERPQ